MSLFEAFGKWRGERPEDPAFLVSSDAGLESVSWRRFTDAIASFAAFVDRTAPRGKVALLGENSPAWMVVHAACLFSGATVVPLDEALTAEEVAERLKFVGVTVLFHTAPFAAKAQAVAKAVSGMALCDLDVFFAAAAEDGAAFWKRGPRYESGQTSMIVFTSGTTSEPRGAELTVAGLEAFAAYASMALPMKPGERSVMVLPLHHIFGIAATYYMLSCGVALGACPDFRRLFDAVVRCRADFLFLVPALVDVMAAKIEQRGTVAREVLGHPLRWIVHGGAPISPRTCDRMEALGVRMLSAYGLTETTALYSIDVDGEEVRAGSAGRRPRLPSCEVKVSAAGELLTRSPGVMKGYFKMPERTAEALDADGWLHTGDLGRIDADGTVWVTGRLSRTIVLSSGKKVAPEELEALLLVIPGVDEAVVTGAGETREIRAEVYGSVTPEALDRAVSELNMGLPTYKRLSGVAIRPTPFPRTSSGKICV